MQAKFTLLIFCFIPSLKRLGYNCGIGLFGLLGTGYIVRSVFQVVMRPYSGSLLVRITRSTSTKYECLQNIRIRSILKDRIKENYRAIRWEKIPRMYGRSPT